MNPYYDSDRLGLETLSWDQAGAYEFDILCFWATPDGRIYTAQDSGCSCPTPFEDYEGRTQDEVLQQLERVGSLNQALSAFDSWNTRGSGANRQDLIDWMGKHLKV